MVVDILWEDWVAIRSSLSRYVNIHTKSKIIKVPGRAGNQTVNLPQHPFKFWERMMNDRHRTRDS